MAITGTFFLFLFLPLALFVYYIADKEIKEYVLVGISLVFYALGSLQYIVLFMIIVILTVMIGRGIGNNENKIIKRSLLIIGIIVNSGILIYYKYTDFAIDTFNKLTSNSIQIKGLLLPLGISFFTFKSISYLVDVYKGEAKLEDKAIHDALYLSFFAQIQSGPLSRYNNMKREDDKTFDKELFTDGVYRFIIGFNKKVLLSNVLANITIEVFSTPFDNFSTSYAWLGSICYSLQLFFDFAGYSDMAIGISEMFGYRCMENFNYPYMTESVTKFWRRWHISLSEWFRDYIYIPLGGSRTKVKWGLYVNLLVVWILTGVWHGAAWNFVIWGLGYFVIIAFEKITKLPERLRSNVGRGLYRTATLLFINFQWVLFNSKNIRSGLTFIKKMLIYTSNELMNRRTLFLIKDYGFFILVAIMLSFPLVQKLDEKLESKKMMFTTYQIIKMLIIIGAFMWAISFVVVGQNNPFAYANF